MWLGMGLGLSLGLGLGLGFGVRVRVRVTCCSPAGWRIGGSAYWATYGAAA